MSFRDRFILTITLGAIMLYSPCMLGQPGFSKTFDFGSGAGFHNAVLIEDTVVIAGTAKDLNSNQWGALFVKMDTMGNILTYKLHTDSANGQFAFEKGFDIIQTSDGGYLTTGVLHNRESYFILKLDANGEQQFFKEFEHGNNILTSHPRKLVEIEDGYFLISDHQTSNYNRKIFVAKLSDAGLLKWELTYGLLSKSQSLGSVWKADTNTFVIGASRGTDVSHSTYPGAPNCYKSWIFAIDSTGEKQWEWSGEPCEESKVSGIHRTSDGGWIYGTFEKDYFGFGVIGLRPKIVHRDSNFNLLWERHIANSYSDLNTIRDLSKMSNGHWVGTATVVLPEPYNPTSGSGFLSAGCLYKVTGQGDSVWRACDTVSSVYRPAGHQLGGSVVLPSGSVIAVGSVDGYKNDQYKSFGWVLKVGKNGCIDSTGCNVVTSVSGVPTNISNGVNVYPNPSESVVRLEHPDIKTWDRIKIYNTSGIQEMEYRDQKQLSIASLQPGIYIIKAWRDDQFVVKKIIKK